MTLTKRLVFDTHLFRKLQSRQAAPLKFVQQLFPPFLRRLHPSQHILFQNHFIGRCSIHRSRYATTLMTSGDSGARRDAYGTFAFHAPDLAPNADRA